MNCIRDLNPPGGIYEAHMGKSIQEFLAALVAVAKHKRMDMVTGKFNDIEIEALATSDWRDLYEIWALKSEIRRLRAWTLR